jgi:hypothetical protein
MTLLRALVLPLVLSPLGNGCARSSASRAGDSTTVVALDSADRKGQVTVTPPAAGPATSTKGAPGSGQPTTNPAAATPVPASGPTATPSETVLMGKVTAGGLASDPMTSLTIDGAKPAILIGPLEPDLRRLNSATVSVAGAPASSPPGAFTVTRYEIISIDGAKPLVGTLLDRAGAQWLATERDTVRLASVSADLTAKTGSKVWIVGRRTGADLVVQTFGVIRER